MYYSSGGHPWLFDQSPLFIRWPSLLVWSCPHYLSGDHPCLFDHVLIIHQVAIPACLIMSLLFIRWPSLLDCVPINHKMTIPVWSCPHYSLFIRWPSLPVWSCTHYSSGDHPCLIMFPLIIRWPSLFDHASINHQVTIPVWSCLHYSLFIRWTSLLVWSCPHYSSGGHPCLFDDVPIIHQVAIPTCLIMSPLFIRWPSLLDCVPIIHQVAIPACLIMSLREVDNVHYSQQKQGQRCPTA